VRRIYWLVRRIT